MTAIPVDHEPLDMTGWVRLGTVTSGHSPVAIVSADAAGDLFLEWTRRREASFETTDRVEQEELLLTGSQQSEQLTGLGDEVDDGLLFNIDMSAVVEGRFGDPYGTGHMMLLEVRVRMWQCECACHDDQELEEHDACPGDCCEEHWTDEDDQP